MATPSRSTRMSESAAGSPLAGPSGHSVSAALQHQFQDIEQQRDAGNFGMWVILATEMLFFGGVFTGYIIYLSLYYSGFSAVSYSLEVNLCAGITFVLLASLFILVMFVHAPLR